jgi:hypothetical protein
MRPLQILTIAVVISFVFSCTSDEPEPGTTICRPLTLRLDTSIYFDSIAYVYDAKGRPEKLLYFNQNATLVQTHYLEYNEQGQLVRAARENDYADRLLNLDIVYNNKGKVEQVIWRHNDGVSVVTTTTFTHDARGRMLTVTDDIYKTRYEYEGDNVSKIFYTPHGKNEILARENHSFDNHKRFFADTQELVVLHTYVFLYEPSKNNVISSTIYMPGIHADLDEPAEVSSALTYDDNGMVMSNYVSPHTLPFMPIESKMKNITYSCN